MFYYLYTLSKPVQCYSVISHSSTIVRNQHSNINTLVIATKHICRVAITNVFILFNAMLQKYVEVCKDKHFYLKVSCGKFGSSCVETKLEL